MPCWSAAWLAVVVVVVGVVVFVVGVWGLFESVFGAGVAVGGPGALGRPIWLFGKGSGAAADSWSVV